MYCNPTLYIHKYLIICLTSYQGNAIIKKNGGEEMYEKITAYLDFFGRDAIPESELQEKTKEFSVDFMQSGFMVSNAMEAMGERAWASKSQLREDASAMTAEGPASVFPHLFSRRVLFRAFWRIWSGRMCCRAF